MCACGQRRLIGPSDPLPQQTAGGCGCTSARRWRVARAGAREGKGRRRRTLPQGRPCSTIRAARLNDRVRDGNGCDPRAIAADQFRICSHGMGIVRGEESQGWEALRVRSAHIWGRRSRLPVRPVWIRKETGQATRAISTARLSRSPCLHLRPIDVLVSNGPSEGLRPGSARLGGGFPLRCFQRFSRPNIATRRYPWQNSRYTRGQSIPVLSY